MLAIMHALAKWRQYLLGSKFSIHIDHNILQYLLRQKKIVHRTIKVDGETFHL
jgi:hypothetical protein